MKCEQVQERLSEYLENILDPDSYTGVHDHLSSCPHCQAEAQFLAQTKQAVAELPSVEPPPGFSQRVMARVREQAGKPSLWQRLFLPLKIKIPIHALAILLVAGLAVYLYQANKPVETEVARMKSLEPQPLADIELYSQPPATPPPPSPEQKSREMDETTAAAPGRSQDLKKEKKLADQGVGTLEAKKGSRLEASDKSPAKEIPASKALPALAPSSVMMADYELNFIPNERLEGMKVLAPKLKAIVEKVGGEYLRPTESSDTLKQDFLLRPQTIWLTVPENRYDQFKTELTSLGKIKSEVKGAEAPSPLRIKLTILLAEKPEKPLPAEQPVR